MSTPSATRTRVIAALVMAPFAIGAILLLPTSWLVMLAALVFLVGLWEWFKLAEIDDTLQRTVLLTANLLLMVLLVWASRGSTDLVPLRLMALVGAVWWLLALLWLRFFHFASDHETWARVFKLAAGTLAVVPAWCALGLIHSSEPNGHIWLFVALAIVWAVDSGRAPFRRPLVPRQEARSAHQPQQDAGRAARWPGSRHAGGGRRCTRRRCGRGAGAWCAAGGGVHGVVLGGRRPV